MKQFPQKEELSHLKILMMCIISGSVIVMLYAAALHLQVFSGILPNIAVFYIFGILGLVITQFGFMFYFSKKLYRSWNIKNILGLKTKLSLKEYLIWIPILIILTVGLLMITQAVGKFLQGYFFDWVPDWFVFDTDLTNYSNSTVLITLLLALIGGVLIGVITEEIFFRGFLLPRMAWLGKWTVLLHVIVFAGYHFWSPWMFVPRVVALIPFIYIIKKKDSLILAIWFHCILNLVGDVIIPAIEYYL
jgi:membrane protease YdiL (CAAX protease family)